MTTRPKRGDPVWKRGRAQPNGIVWRIDWQEQEVLVFFYDDTYEPIPLDDFDDAWTQLYGGGWLMEE